MTNARLTGQRIRAGTYASTDLTSGYEVIQLPIQSDQNSGIQWIIAGDGTTTPTPARITVNGDESQTPDGFYTWRWRMSYLTFAMNDYWLSTFLPANVWSAPVTVMTYDETDTAVWLNALLYRPNYPSDKVVYAPAGWGQLIWEFKKGVIIAPP